MHRLDGNLSALHELLLDSEALKQTLVEHGISTDQTRLDPAWLASVKCARRHRCHPKWPGPHFVNSPTPLPPGAPTTPHGGFPGIAHPNLPSTPIR